jgi:hypothetical protein
MKWDPDRRIASIAAREARGIELSRDDRRSWQAWAQDRLKETQSAIDLVDARSELRPVRQDLTDMANSYVAFDGYAHLSQVDRMLIMLDRIRQRSAHMVETVCSPSGSASK